MRLKDFGRAIGELNMQSLVSMTSLTALIETGNKLIDGAGSWGDSLASFSRETGGSTDELQQLTHAFQDVGVSADKAKGIMGALTFKMGERTNFMMQGPYQEWRQLMMSQLGLGIDPSQFSTAGQLLDAMFQKLHGMNAMVRSQLLHNVSMPPEIADLMSLSPERYRAARAGAPPMSNADISKSLELQGRVADLAWHWNEALTKAGVNIMDIKMGLVDVLDGWIRSVSASEEFADTMRGLQSFFKGREWADVLTIISGILTTIDWTIRDIIGLMKQLADTDVIKQTLWVAGKTLNLSAEGWRKAGLAMEGAQPMGPVFANPFGNSDFANSPAHHLWDNIVKGIESLGGSKNITIKTVVQSNDPNTTVKHYVENRNRDIKSAITQLGSGQS